MLGAIVLTVLFVVVLAPVLQKALSTTFEKVVEQRLTADASTLITAAKWKNGQLDMPERLPDEEFNLPDTNLLGFIYDGQGRLVWKSRSAENGNIHYAPRYDGGATEFLRLTNADGIDYYAYDVELNLGDTKNSEFSFITMQPTKEYDNVLKHFRDQLFVWLGGGLLLLLVLLALGLNWSFRRLRLLSHELDEIECGDREHLSDSHPQELLRLTRSLNRLLNSEQRQRARYQHALADLAHSLKTPLTVLQGMGESQLAQGRSAEQALILLEQVERMSQQVDYQLQRARLVQMGLVRHREPVEPLVASLCGALDKVYHAKHVQRSWDIPSGVTLSIERSALMELLGNVLENAYRLCKQRVSLSMSVDQHGWRIVIADDGDGVPEEQLDRILQRGGRLDVQHAGQGIGLAVVKDILQSYGGELSLERSALGGAAFSLWLPDDDLPAH